LKVLVLLALAALAAFTPRGSSLDVLICIALVVVAVLLAVGGWLRGAFGEWWANVDPSPHPLALKPRYWREETGRDAA
jgi:hypothetical protein